jgi:ubiquitin carboxyl-terminal hydrolase 36/42
MARKPFRFRATTRGSLPVRYFNAEWTRVIIQQNVIKQPLGGLNNLGLSCFMNSVLQCLAYSPGLPFFAEHIPNIIYESNLGRPCFLHHFGELCKAMRSLNSVAPHVFFTNVHLVCPGMRSGQQQDAHEFLFSLLNMFDKECEQAFGRSHGKFDTAIHAIFGGRLGEIRECETCGTDLDTESRFLDITLPIESNTIEGCFEQMLLAQGSSDCFCKRCRKQSSCSNRSLFRETPQVLIVTMMRFAANGLKIEKAVDFGFEIDLSPFVAKGVHPLFELFGLVVHNGHQLSHGHFSSYVKCSTGVWYSADDSRVVKISANTVLLSRPYILFYKRKEVSAPLSPVIVTFGLSDDSEDE